MSGSFHLGGLSLSSSTDATSVSVVGLAAEYLLNEGTGHTSSNQVDASPTNNLLVCPDGPFIGGNPWNAGAEITDRYALAPYGPSAVTRWHPGGGTAFQQGVSVTPGTYTLSLRVCSNTGASQKIATELNGVISADVTIPATGSIRIVRSVTYSSAMTDGIAVLYPDAAHDPNDISFWDVQFVRGTLPEDVGSQSYLGFVGAPVWTANGVDLSGGGTNYLLASQARQNVQAMSVYCVMRWPTANNAATAGQAALVGDCQSGAGYYLCALNGPTSPSWTIGGQTIYAPLCNLHDGNWHLVAATSSGSGLAIYIDGVQVASSTQAAGVFQTFLAEIGNLNVGGFAFPGQIAYASIYHVGHSQAQQAAQFTAIQSIVAAKGVALSILPKFVTFEGDSITAGLGGTTIYPVTVMADIVPIVQARNFAVPGNQLTDLTARAATVDANASPARARNVLSVLIGHNDMNAGAESAATFVANLKTYCLARRAAGWNRIVLGTVLPSTLAGFNALRDAANAAIRADPSFYDQLADYDTNATIGADAAPSNTTYYIDGTHPTTAGYSLMAPITQAAIAAALA